MRKYIQDNGTLGIAANQVNSTYRILCYREGDEIINCINPKITKEFGRVAVYNTDPSFPDLLCRTTRHNKIKVEYFEVKEASPLELKRKTLKKQSAFVFQQCVDLLDGIVIFDKAMNVSWMPEFQKIYRVVGSDDYFVQGDTKTWFYGIDVTENMDVQIVGIKLQQPEAEIRERTQEEINWLLNSEEGKVLTVTQRSILSGIAIAQDPEISEQETKLRIAATLWLHNKIDTSELLNQNEGDSK